MQKGGKLSAALLILGIIIGLICLFVAYKVSYEGVGPDDTKSRILITILIVGGIITATVLVLMGWVAFWTPGLSGQEITGFSEVRRRKP